MKNFLLNIIPDFLVLIGLSSILYGIYLIYFPAVFIFFGFVLVLTFRPVEFINYNSNNVQNKGNKSK